MAVAWTRHPVIAGTIGVFAGGLAIALIEWLAHQWLGKADLAKPATISTTMFATVLIAWVLGAGTAALVATAWGEGRSLVPGLVSAGVLMAGSLVTLFSFPHPAWMVGGALVLMPLAAWLAARSRVVRDR